MYELLFSDWGPVPFRTIATCARSTRVLARAGATGFKLVWSRHRKPPYETFIGLRDPDYVADTLSKRRRCLLDLWTEGLVWEHCKGDPRKLRSKAFQVGQSMAADCNITAGWSRFSLFPIFDPLQGFPKLRPGRLDSNLGIPGPLK